MSISFNNHKNDSYVSVIIPTFNRSGMLEEAVKSVLLQDYKHFELIVVDDGSMDNTSKILNLYRQHIRIHRQSNKGVSAARNAGIEMASGRYIAFLDSDDLWMPRKLSTQVRFFQQNHGALICQTEEIWMRNGVRIYPQKKHRKPSGYIFDRSLHLCLVSPSAVMMRRELFDYVGRFDESLPACEDYDLWLRVSARHPVYLIDDPLIIKRGGHPDQLSGTPALDKYRIRSLQKLLDHGELSEDQYHKAVAVLKYKCGIYANGCIKRGRENEAEVFRAIADNYPD